MKDGRESRYQLKLREVFKLQSDKHASSQILSKLYFRSISRKFVNKFLQIQEGLGHKNVIASSIYIDPDLRPFSWPDLLTGVGTSPPSDDCRSWYSWKHGTMHRFVWHSGQWYFVFRRRIRPWASIVFQQKLQPSAGPGRSVGQWLDRVAVSKDKSLRVEA